MDKGNPLYSFIAILFRGGCAQLILVPLAQLTGLTESDQEEGVQRVCAGHLGLGSG